MNRRRPHLDGSASVELVLLAPVLVMLVLLVVVAGRSGEVLQQVKHAADQGARAASTASEVRRTSRGNAAALNDLRVSGSSCKSPRVVVSTSTHDSMRQVKVHVTCTVNHSGLALLGLGSKQVTAESVEVLDVYRSK